MHTNVELTHDFVPARVLENLFSTMGAGLGICGEGMNNRHYSSLRRK